MRLFDKMREPVVLKEHSLGDEQLNLLKQTEPLLNKNGKKAITQDIRNLEYGIYGENSILYELKNSHLPIYILRDINLKFNELNAQIDFIVFTPKICIIIECKNLYGNIEINNRGEFIRKIEYNGKTKKEGIYSPITQNQRHLELIKARKISNQTNKLAKLAIEKSFNNIHKSVVVLANPKTVINMKYAKKEIKNKIIRVDQLVNHIKEMHNNSKESKLSCEKHLEWAKAYLSVHQDISIEHFTDKYDQYREVEIPSSKDIVLQKNNHLYNKLKEHRLSKSREEKIKPYYIFNNKQLEELVAALPKEPIELLKISGFGEVKVSKYGNEITQIISKYK